MLKKVLHFLNPIYHLGEKKYPILFPAIFTSAVYIISELLYYFLTKKNTNTGTIDVVLTLLLVIYFSFRSAIKGGLTITAISIVFFTYFISTHAGTTVEKETATFVAGLLTVVYLVISFSLGWLRQTVDDVLAKEIQTRKHAEEAEEKFHMLADNIPTLCWMAKADGSIFWYNKRWYDYTGKTFKQLQGWGWKSVHDPKRLPEVLKRWKHAINNEQYFEMTFPLKGADGKFRQFLTRIVPMRDSEGKLIHWFGTNTDITDQKRIEQQKDDFIALVSHELRTPITSAKIYVQTVMKEYTDNPKAANLVGKLNDQIEKLRILINTILDSVRMEQGKVETPEEPFILGEIALPTIASIQDTTTHKLTVDWQTTEYLFGNKEKIGQVLTNLITNAIKYSPANSEIIIKSQKINDNIVVSVEDSGIGLSKEEQKYVFDRFYQSSEHKTYPGLGLGLYISMGIIKQHGGKLWVISEKGKGSIFYFSLPIYKKSPKKNTVSMQKKLLYTKKRQSQQTSN